MGKNQQYTQFETSIILKQLVCVAYKHQIYFG